MRAMVSGVYIGSYDEAFMFRVSGLPQTRGSVVGESPYRDIQK